MNRFDISRRQALKLLGATGLLGAMPLSFANLARAAEGKPPLRLLVYHLASGISKAEAAIQGPGGTPPTETSWELNRVMQDLAAFKDRITVFRNLDMISNRFDPTPASSGHYYGKTHYTTADFRLQGRGSKASGPSFEQYIAERIHKKKALTRHRSINAASYIHEGDGYFRIWRGNGVEEKFVSRPDNLFRLLFPNLNDPSRRTREERALAFLSKRAQNASQKLSAQDRRFIDSHLQLRKELSDSFLVTTERDRLAPTFDDIKSKTPSPQTYETGYEQIARKSRSNSSDGELDTLWHTNHELNSQLIAYAFHADATRIANLASSEVPYIEKYLPGNARRTNTGWHGVDHGVNQGGAFGGNPLGYQPGQIMYESFIENQRWQVKKLARLLEILNSFPELDGSTLLDNTLVVVVSHLSNGSHTGKNLPWFTIGDAQGFFRPGRYLELKDRNLDPQNRYNGRAHADLFVSIAQAMETAHDFTPDKLTQSFGVDMQVAGMKKICGGPILEWHR